MKRERGRGEEGVKRISDERQGVGDREKEAIQECKREAKKRKKKKRKRRK